ncbi:exopolysaccharide biosynthesis polyprenyl glycosylphosphotransferase [Pedobacter rhizosphaerae]|uniref:Putative colanic acid biosysnthesis UDP-glucose lipid carrier transferase n=1 Tax=Pedobacter rhizosphaerae TaxID=390241 RepID=A0A1H9SI70_9SPHI|nr:exopolysaccharide biosynthesis polyprenyl glycosylphosphotransferase [Pedobacter rhizosphaerae]SER84598.1 putative colanic acid biosysnthesis UDP-glucose lipid carrier transferase [Pedobacter rhizosphaerae]
MVQRYTNINRIFFIIMDLIALNVLFLLPFVLFEQDQEDDLKDVLILNLTSNIIWLLSSYILAAYVIYREINLRNLARRTTISYIIFALLISIFIGLSDFANGTFLMARIVVGFGIVLLVSRLILISYVLYTRSNSKFFQKIIIIGYNETANALINTFASSQGNFRFLGCFDDIELTEGSTNLHYLGRIDKSLSFAKENQIAEIYCTLSPEESPYLYELAENAEKQFIRFRFVPDIYKFLNRKAHLDFVDEIPVLSLRPEPMNFTTAQFKKRFLDIIISTIVILFILSWLLPILAVIIKIDSEGPVFFKQQRGGKNNKVFSCIKLRTLTHGQTPADAERQVKQGDSRLTRVGSFLRKTNLDELPQFFNVLIGNMSVVGARPHMLQHDITFASLENRYLIRLLSKPGVTGWAQINGLRGEIKNDVQLKKRVEYDIWYIENWNTWLDLKIIWLTVQRMIKGDENAY